MGGEGRKEKQSLVHQKVRAVCELAFPPRPASILQAPEEPRARGGLDGPHSSGCVVYVSRHWMRDAREGNSREPDSGLRAKVYLAGKTAMIR